MKAESYWVYILLCENGYYYTGYTSDLEKRYAARIEGIVSKYTRSFKPVNIAQSWKITGGKSLAMKIENPIKKITAYIKRKSDCKPKFIIS